MQGYALIAAVVATGILLVSLKFRLGLQWAVFSSGVFFLLVGLCAALFDLAWKAEGRLGTLLKRPAVSIFAIALVLGALLCTAILAMMGL